MRTSGPSLHHASSSSHLTAAPLYINHNGAPNCLLTNTYPKSFTILADKLSLCRMLVPVQFAVVEVFVFSLNKQTNGRQCNNMRHSGQWEGGAKWRRVSTHVERLAVFAHIAPRHTVLVPLQPAVPEEASSVHTRKDTEKQKPTNQRRPCHLAPPSYEASTRGQTNKLKRRRQPCGGTNSRRCSRADLAALFDWQWEMRILVSSTEPCFKQLI